MHLDVDIRTSSRIYLLVNNGAGGGNLDEIVLWKSPAIRPLFVTGRHLHDQL